MSCCLSVCWFCDHAPSAVLCAYHFCSRLEELAGAIRAKLAYFDELEAVAAQVGGGSRLAGSRLAELSCWPS